MSAASFFGGAFFGGEFFHQPTVVVTQQPGGTSRRIKGKRPPYWWEIGRTVEMPVDPIAFKAADDIRRQTATLLKELADGDTEFDRMLEAVAQIETITARFIESRQIYDIVQEVKGRIQARKDAETGARLAIAAAEEEEVKELMEFL